MGLSRLAEEYNNLQVIATSPSVKYRAVIDSEEETFEIGNVQELDELVEKYTGSKISLYEPIIESTLIYPSIYEQAVQNVCLSYRGEETSREFLGSSFSRTLIHMKFPVADIMTDFFSKLKSASKGHASFDYEDGSWKLCEAHVLEVILNNQPVPELSQIVTPITQNQIAQKIGNVLKKRLTLS